MRPAPGQMGLAERLRRLGRRSALFDVSTAVLIWVIGLVDVWLLAGPLADILAKLATPATYSPTLAVLAISGMTLPLALRRIFPVTTLTIVTASFAVISLQLVPEGIATSIALLIAVYSVGAYAPRFALASRIVCLVVVAAMIGYQLRASDSPAPPQLDSAEVTLLSLFNYASSTVVSALAFAIAWILGDAVRRSRQRQAQLAQRTAELAAANETIASQAVAAERLRIARDLHDVVAHHVSVMGLQAGAARRVIDRDKDAAVRSLRIVEETSRRAVDELQRLLGMLRGTAAGDADAPQPTSGDLVDLVERMRQSGLDVRVRTNGAPVVLPAGVELSVYRVVQEALTNALKHAGSSARVDVDISYAADELKLAVRSRSAFPTGRAGRGAGGNGTVPIGRGIIGMRERVGMHGGQLQAHALGDGGFEVLARIPI